MEFERYIKSLSLNKRFKLEIETAKMYLRDNPPEKYKQYSIELIWALDVILLGGNSGQFIKFVNQAENIIKSQKETDIGYFWIKQLYDLYLKTIRKIVNKLEEEKKNK